MAQIIPQVPRVRIPEFAELDALMNAGILTAQQQDILYRRVNGESYKSIRNVYSISRSTVARALMRTASCRKWSKGMKGGGLTLLSDADEKTFERLAKEMTNELNCITTAMATAICCELQAVRIKFAAKVLLAAHCPHLVAKLEDYCPEPSKGWLDHMAKRLNIRICSSQTIEAIRRTTVSYTHLTLPTN